MGDEDFLGVGFQYREDAKRKNKNGKSLWVLHVKNNTGSRLKGNKSVEMEVNFSF
jgi:hypothetical protein